MGARIPQGNAARATWSSSPSQRQFTWPSMIIKNQTLIEPIIIEKSSSTNMTINYDYQLRLSTMIINHLMTIN